MIRMDDRLRHAQDRSVYGPAQSDAGHTRPPLDLTMPQCPVNHRLGVAGRIGDRSIVETAPESAVPSQAKTIPPAEKVIVPG